MKNENIIKRLESGLSHLGWQIEVTEQSRVNDHVMAEIKIIANRELPYGEYKRLKGFGNVIIATGEYNEASKTMPVTLLAGKISDNKSNLLTHIEAAYAEADVQGYNDMQALGYVLRKFAISTQTIKNYAKLNK